MTPRRWVAHGLAALMLALVCHALVVWLLPRLIMQRVMASVKADTLAQPAVQAERQAEVKANVPVSVPANVRAEAKQGTEQSAVLLPPMTDHRQRRIVMPSPDLLYALCAFDLHERALRIRMQPVPAGLNRYWSVALYAANSDNFFVVNDRQAAGRGLDFLLVAPGAAAPPEMPGTTVLAAPSARGLLLMRVLVGDYAAERDAVEAVRRSLRCESARV